MSRERPGCWSLTLIIVLSLLAGGVACNTRLRRGFEETGKKHGYKVFMPSPQYTTDNAAMIAAAGFLHFENGRFASPDLNADPNWKL